MSYLKPQTPIQLNENYIYPLTTADQVILNNGNRLNSLFKKTIKENATLQVANWSDTKPYTQTITLTESTDDYNVDVNIVYNGNEADTELNKAAGCISYIKKNHKEITFYCLKNKPEIDIPIEITGTCRNTIATVEEGIKLNFDIVAYSSEEDLLADTPAENTIGVVTNTPITGYKFSTTEPDGMSNGEVFIKTDTNSDVCFNIVENTSIYPILAKQYVNGTYIDVVAMIYVNDEWVLLNISNFLFYYGKQQYVWSAKSMAAVTASNNTGVAPTVQTNDDGSVTLSIQKSSNTYTSGIYELSSGHDLTNVNTLIVSYSKPDDGEGAGLTVYPTNADAWSTNSTWGGDSVAAIAFTVADTQKTLDVSGLTGIYKLGIDLGINNGRNSSTCIFKSLKKE